MNESSTPMAVMSAMVTSWRVLHLFVFAVVFVGVPAIEFLLRSVYT